MKTHIVQLLIIGMMASSVTANAQLNYNHFSGHQQGYWTFGLNGGLAYQSSDVRSTADGYGLGLTLAKNWYYHPNALLSFDMRGRFLFTRQYGEDSHRNYGILNNNVLNSSGLNYTATGNSGFVFNNYRTTTGELAIEGVFTFNRLRERTGVVLSLYGGAGLDWYKAKTDQAAAGGGIYNYKSIDTTASRRAILNSLNSLRDGQYESVADGNKSLGRIGFMPALGVELGYQLTRNFLVSIGHKITFSRTDILDGVKWSQNNTATSSNDIYHYTSLDFKWIIDPVERQRGDPPRIEIIQPRAISVTTYDPVVPLEANIYNVSSQADVILMLNGAPLSFHLDRRLLRRPLPLRPGENRVRIVATNPYGQDQKEIFIYLGQRGGPVPIPVPVPDRHFPPKVTITNPSTNPATTYEDHFRLTATVVNVERARDIEMTFNGRSFNDFNYSGNTLEARLILQPGENNIRIRARNREGDAHDEVTIRFQQRSNPPGVTITEPNSNPYTTNQSTVTVHATITNIDRRDNISVRVDNNEISNFNFARGYLDFPIRLHEGENRVVISAGNDANRASDNVTILYKSVQNNKHVPVVTITQPNTESTTVNKEDYIVKARIENIQAKGDITFILNGSTSSLFNFANGQFDAGIKLKEGNNQVRIIAKNRDGVGQKEVNIRYIKGINNLQQPKVNIDRPINYESVNNPSVSMQATVKNVNNKNDITINLNNKPVDFNFDNVRGYVTSNLTLLPGLNTIRVNVKNNAGADQSSVDITYNEQSILPRVTIDSPLNGSKSPNSNIVLQAKVKNVVNKNDIHVLLDGRDIPFDFNLYSKSVVSNINLKEGNHVIRVNARNQEGEDHAEISIAFIQMHNPPVVTISMPSNKSVVSNLSIDLIALVTNVVSTDQVTVSVNGSQVRKITLGKGGNCFAKLLLQSGSNSIKVEARNNDGTDSKEINVTYQPPVQKPVVIIQKPEKSGMSFPDETYVVVAQINNVTSSNDISVTVNNAFNKDFSFDSKSGQLTIRVPIGRKSSVVKIIATNASGSAQASTQLSRAAMVVKIPVITIVSLGQPVIDPLNPNSAKSTIIAQVTNITDKNQVSLLVNNAGTDFSWDASSNTLQETVTLKRGDNLFAIKAQNRDGKDEKSRTIKW